MSPARCFRDSLVLQLSLTQIISVLIYSFNNKWGLANYQGKGLIPAVFHDLQKLRDDVYIYSLFLYQSLDGSRIQFQRFCNQKLPRLRRFRGLTSNAPPHNYAVKVVKQESSLTMPFRLGI